jgi:glutamate formiminotransferase/formiminotetrahydrofolate cyclodeaminase
VQLNDFSTAMVLEHKVRAAVQGGESVSGFVASVAAPTPAPGGGTVAAHAASLGAALAQMVAGLTIGKKKYAAVEAEMKEAALKAAALVTELTTLGTRDAEAYGKVMAAYKLPSENESDAAKRKQAIDTALLGAAEVPLETARACLRVLEVAEAVATRGNTNAVSDAGVSALLAEAACRGAVYNVRINVSSLEDKSKGAPLITECERLLKDAASRARAVTASVEKAIG